MSSEMYNCFLEIVKRKANTRKEDIEKGREYKAHYQNLLNDKALLNKMEDQLERAFLIGAVDAMILDVALGLAMPAYVSYSSRTKLIKEILTDC